MRLILSLCNSHLFIIFVSFWLWLEYCLLLLQHMDNKELTRRIATGTLYSTSVMARTIMNLSTDPNKAVRNAQVIMVYPGKLDLT